MASNGYLICGGVGVDPSWMRGIGMATSSSRGVDVPLSRRCHVGGALRKAGVFMCRRGWRDMAYPVRDARG